ncbi:MAG: cytochrome c [Anaerolineaceae bacterium]|nr:cytochrome c [Anaerolineaceae bacterium]
MTRKLFLLILTIAALTVSACGTIATPEFSAEARGTQAALAVTSEHLTAIAPTATPTNTPLPPTATPIPPTSTPVPPTETSVPTEVPTETPLPTDTPAASAGGSDVPTGDATKGEALFNEFRSEVNFACANCHYVDQETQLIGPGLLNVSIRGETREPGVNAIEYIHQSIVSPSAYVVEGYPDMLMPQIYGQIFTEEQIQDLIAYLFTLRG